MQDTKKQIADRPDPVSNLKEQGHKVLSYGREGKVIDIEVVGHVEFDDADSAGNLYEYRPDSPIEGATKISYWKR